MRAKSRMSTSGSETCEGASAIEVARKDLAWATLGRRDAVKDLREGWELRMDSASSDGATVAC